MPQTLSQTQQQKLEQQQLLHLSQQQILAMDLLHMPLAKLEENVLSVLDDNPALEKEYDADSELLMEESRGENPGNDDSDNADANNEDYEDELTKALQNMGRDDDMEDRNYGDDMDNEDSDFSYYSSSKTFIDNLTEQMNELELSETEHQIMEYLIGSLDADGLLRKNLDNIADELAIYHYVDVTEEDIKNVLLKLQEFEPAGIGAQSLQECLRIQTKRLSDSSTKQLMLRIIDEQFEEFLKKHWEKIQKNLLMTDSQIETAINALRKLNPKPGAAMSENIEKNIDHITPDIIIEVDDDGRVSFTINQGNVPALKISEDYEDELKQYGKIPDNKLSKADREAIAYYKEKVEKANWYIEAIKQRFYTMAVCTKAIIKWQHQYFVDGDETELKPMILKDISEMTGLDISTISRFSNQKYADTPWGIKSMKFFFNDGYTNEEGEEMVTKKIKLKLKEIIDKEDKRKPKSDEKLTKEMAEAGYHIARRTIAKYREQMGIPVARLRK